MVEALDEAAGDEDSDESSEEDSSEEDDSSEEKGQQISNRMEWKLFSVLVIDPRSLLY